MGFQSSINSLLGMAALGSRMYQKSKAMKDLKDTGTEKTNIKSEAEPEKVVMGADTMAEQKAMQHLSEVGNQQIEQNIRLKQHRALVEAYNRGDFQNLPIEQQQRIAQRVSELEFGNEEDIK